ncbi:MAG: hypothetical protein DRH57_09180 [Candidatus Cloacimonadota bacterium]|nr:MAG: hypothetical protein DRH57_09180 [Candidatus Cloacimonadota bacterium]
MSKFSIGSMVAHYVTDGKDKVLYCSEIMGYQNGNKKVFEVNVLFYIKDKKPIKTHKAHKGLITKDQAVNKKLKKILKKYPEYFI